MNKLMSEISSQELLVDVEQHLKDIVYIENLVSDVNSGNQVLDSTERIFNFMEKFKSTHKFINECVYYLNYVDDNIAQLKDFTDISPSKMEKINLINIDFDMTIDSLEKTLFDFYKIQIKSDMIVKEDIQGYILSCKLKGISPSIIEELIGEDIEKNKKHNGIEVFEINDDIEYSYEIRTRTKAGNLDEAVTKMEAFVNSIFYIIRKYEIHREDMYFSFYNYLAEVYNKAADIKPYYLDNFTPFKWQLEAFRVWGNKENNYHGTFDVCTGAGKTYFALYSIQKLINDGYDLRVSIVVPSKAIMQQWYNILIERFHVNSNEVGRKGDGHKCLWNDKKFIIYISNTAQKQIATDTLALEEFRKIRGENFYHFYLMDECHHYATENSLQMLDGLTQLKFHDNGIEYLAMGLSATPDRVDKKEQYFYQAIGNVVYKYDILEALADNVVSPFIIHNLDSPLINEEIKILKGINKAYSIAESNLAKQLTDYNGKMKTKIDEIREYSSEAILQIAYAMVNSSRKKVDKLYEKQNSFIKKYSNNGNSYFEEWLEGRPDDKLIYLANKLTAIYDKKIYFIQNSNKRQENCIKYSIKNKDRKVIVFCEYIDSADEIYNQLVEMFDKHRIKRYYSLTKEQLEESGFAKYEREKENREALEAFARSTANIIITVKSFNEGIDIPNADIAIIYQSKVSKRESIQRLGRIVRKNRAQGNRENEKTPILYFLYAKEQKEKIFLKDYFEKPNLINGDGNFDNVKAEKYKTGLKMIKFYPPNEYNFSKYIE